MAASAVYLTGIDTVILLTVFTGCSLLDEHLDT